MIHFPKSNVFRHTVVHVPSKFPNSFTVTFHLEMKPERTQRDVSYFPYKNLVPRCILLPPIDTSTSRNLSKKNLSTKFNPQIRLPSLKIMQ